MPPCCQAAYVKAAFLAAVAKGEAYLPMVQGRALDCRGAGTRRPASILPSLLWSRVC